MNNHNHPPITSRGRGRINSDRWVGPEASGYHFAQVDGISADTISNTQLNGRLPTLDAVQNLVVFEEAAGRRYTLDLALTVSHPSYDNSHQLVVDTHQLMVLRQAISLHIPRMIRAL